jgi:CDP-diacylglycerol--serine O-phosphatidyltransferase
MADYVTLVNGLSGVMSIFSSLKYCASPLTTIPAIHLSSLSTAHYATGWIYAAMAWIALGTFADVMDGRIARMRNKSSLVGQELDSLADLVSFGVAPAIVAFSIGMQTALDQVLLAVFVLCGLTRLARFNVTVGSMKKDKTGKIASFEGTPIPTSLLLVQLMAFWTAKGWVREALPLGSMNVLGLELHTATLLFSLLGCAMASKSLKIPKL